MCEFEISVQLCLRKYCFLEKWQTDGSDGRDKYDLWPRYLAGSFDALLVGWLVVVVRGLYLARHLFTLLNYSILNIFMPPLLSLGSKGHITPKWSGHSLKSLSQVKYSILNILSLRSKGHITLKWSSHTQVSSSNSLLKVNAFENCLPPQLFTLKILLFECENTKCHNIKE